MNPLRPLARFVVNHPLYVIAFWVIAAVGIVYSAPSLASVTNSDQSSFLPKSSEFSKANNLAQHMFPGSTKATATFVFSRRDGGALTSTDQQTVSAVTADLRAARLTRVAAVATNPSLLSPNRQVQLATVVLTGKSGDKANDPAVKPLRNEAARLLRGTPLVAGLMGDAATQADSDAASQSGQMITMLVTIFLILALVGIIFRSPIAAVFPIAAIILVYTLAQSAIGALATMLHFQVGTLLGYLLIVVLFGIGTDYILFLLFRYRERLRAGDSSKRALMVAVERVGKVVASSALVVITAFMTLLLAQLGFLRSLGPGLSIGVGLMLLAALTLIPAILSLIGPKIFWPSKNWQAEPNNAISRRIGQSVARHPGRTLLAAAGVLIVLVGGLVTYGADYNFDHMNPSNTASAKATKVLQAGFPASASQPTAIFLKSHGPLTSTQLATFERAMVHTAGVAHVLPPKITATGTGAEIDLYLSGGATSNAALTNVQGPIRTAAHHAVPGVTAYVGGETSAIVDMRYAMNHDFKVIFPVAGLVDRPDPAGAAAKHRGAPRPLGLGLPRVRSHDGLHGNRIPGLRHPVLHPYRHLPVRSGSRDRLQHPHGGPDPRRA
jgi:putative drug exporter of the RND superfamily